MKGLLLAGLLAGALIGTACDSLPAGIPTIPPDLGQRARDAATAAQTQVAGAVEAAPGSAATAVANLTNFNVGAFVNSLADSIIALKDARIEVIVNPPFAQPQEAKEVTVEAIDSTGAIGSLDQRARNEAVTALVRQSARVFPNARIEATIRSLDGRILAGAIREPGTDEVKMKGASSPS